MKGYILCCDHSGENVTVPFTANTPEELAVAVTTIGYTGLTVYRVEGK